MNHLRLPSEVLPKPQSIQSVLAVDTEGSGLFPDEGAHVCAISLAYDTDNGVETWAFPFDQGFAYEKGFRWQFNVTGVPKAFPSLRQSNLVRSEEGATGAATRDQFARAVEAVANADLHTEDRNQLNNWLDSLAPYAEVEGVVSRGRLYWVDAAGLLEFVSWLGDATLPEDEWVYLLKWIEEVGRKNGLIFHNANYDLIMLNNPLRNGWVGKWFEKLTVADTMLMSRHLDPTLPAGLKPIGARVWGEQEVAEAAEVSDALARAAEVYGLTGSNRIRYDLIPWDINGPYAAQDTALTLRIYHHFHQRLAEGEGSIKVIQEQLDFMRVLTRLELRGFGPYKSAESNEWANVLAGRIEVLKKQLPFEPATIHTASEYYFKEHGLKPWKVGEQPRGFEILYKNNDVSFIKGERYERPAVQERFSDAKRVTFKQGALTSDIARRMDAPGAEEFAELCALKTANQMFYRNYVDLVGDDGNLRARFRQMHVKSGRLSTERVALHGIPKKPLKLECDGVIIPEPISFIGVPEGKMRWNLDLSQAELRIAANLSGCKPLSEALLGGDVHSLTATNIFGCTPENTPADKWGRYRSIAKQANFGLLFGMGHKKFREMIWKAQKLELPEQECKFICDSFHEAYPELKENYLKYEAFARTHKFVPLYDNEISFLGDRDYSRTGWNRRVQGSLASWVSRWIVLVEALTEEVGALRLTVHDSAVLDLPEDEAEKYVKLILKESEKLWINEFGFYGKLDAEPWKYHEGVDLTVPPYLQRTYLP